MEKYKPAWMYYTESCRKYGLDTDDFSQFIKKLTVDQLEKMLEHSQQI